MTCPTCQAENPPGAEVCFQCRTIIAAITWGTVVAGRYEVRRALGRGGMGTVYEAYDRVLEEEVALKVLRGDVARSPGMAERFRSEIKLARKVSHPNVCRIYEYGEEGALQFLSMELVPGANLKEVLRQRGRLPEDEAIDVVLQAAEGLAAIHDVGVIHRDLKTLNLTIDGSGRVRVMDFGIATRAAEGVTGPTGSGYVMGSPEYMSPEHARGRRLDPRSDVYSLGVVLFELLAGRVPFRAETPVETLLMHLRTPPPLEGEAGVPIPARLAPVLRRALAKEPRDRFASAREMAGALRAASAEGAAVLASRSRSRLPVAAAAVGLLAAAAFVASRSRPERAPAGAPSVPPASPTAPGASPTASGDAVPPPTRAAPGPAEGAAPVTSLPSRRAPVPRVDRPPTSAPAPPASLERTDGSSPPTSAPEPPPTPAAATEAPSAPPAGEAALPASRNGALLVVVQPWAYVSIDGAAAGQTPLARIPLAPGPHSVLLSHPDYQPFPRKVTIRPGETFRLRVDLATDGVRRRP
jgi:serine/threonine-protein kinase